jgi:HD-like signal output (HDOD) protein
MISPTLQHRLESCPTLPSLPAVAVRVMQLCQAENLDLAEIGKVITNDPVLAAKILRLVNSPGYGLPQQVKTVSHAVALLGLNTVRSLSLSFSLAADLRRRPHPNADLKSYWKRSLLAAAGARELVGALGATHLKEEAFLGGLLQDIGRLALLAVVPDLYQPLAGRAADDHGALIAVEHQALGCDHAEVGGWLIERWNLPQPLCLAAAYSHTPAHLPAEADAEVALLVRVVALSGAVADIWLRPDPFEATIVARELASRLLNLLPPHLEPVLARLAASLGDVSSLFEIDVGPAEEIEVALRRARESLQNAR